MVRFRRLVFLLLSSAALVAAMQTPAAMAQLAPHPGGAYTGALEAEGAVSDCLAAPGAEPDPDHLVTGFVSVPEGDCTLDFGIVRFIDPATLDFIVVRAVEQIWLVEWRLEVNGQESTAGSVTDLDHSGWTGLDLGAVAIPFGDQHVRLHLYFEGWPALDVDAILGSSLFPGPISETGCEFVFDSTTCDMVWDATDEVNETVEGPANTVVTTVLYVVGILLEIAETAAEEAEEACYVNLSDNICDEVFE